MEACCCDSCTFLHSPLYVTSLFVSSLPSSTPAHSSSLPCFPFTLSTLLSPSDEEESQGKDDDDGKDKDKDKGRSGSQLHFVGSLPFANMITNTTDMSTYSSAVRTGSMSDQANTYDGAEQGGVSASVDSLSTSISDETECQTDTDCSASENAESATSSGDALVRLANSQLLQKRREDELRAQLAGISLPPLTAVQCSGGFTRLYVFLQPFPFPPCSVLWRIMVVVALTASHSIKSRVVKSPSTVRFGLTASTSCLLFSLPSFSSYSISFHSLHPQPFLFSFPQSHLFSYSPSLPSISSPFHLSFPPFPPGIEAAISKSKKNIAPKLYVRVKDIKRKIQALEELGVGPIVLSGAVGTLTGQGQEQEQAVTSRTPAGFVLGAGTLKGIALPVVSELSMLGSQPPVKRIDLLSTSSDSSSDSVGVSVAGAGISLDQNSISGLVSSSSVGDSGHKEAVKRSRRSDSNRSVNALSKKENSESSKLQRADSVLERASSDLKSEGRIEQTWERIILAEKMRINLSNSIGRKQDGTSQKSQAEQYVIFINKNFAAPKKLEK
jgi:hypothetical protein